MESAGRLRSPRISYGRMTDAQCGAATPASVCLLSLHAQIDIKKFQSGVADVFVQLASINAGGIDAGLGPRVASQCFAFIDEDLVIDQTGQHIELDMGNISCRKLRVFPGRSL